MELKRPFKIDDVILLDKFDGNSMTYGTLTLTPTYLFFISNTKRLEVWLPICLVISAEKYRPHKQGIPLLIKGKDFRTLRLFVKNEKDCQEISTSINNMTAKNDFTKLPCFLYKPPEYVGDRSTGWDSFALEKQYARMGIPNKKWRTSDININYRLCDTYPQLLCFPESCSSYTLQESANFRSRSRLPVLSYLHPNKNSVICRSSQTLSGFNRKCLEDIDLLEQIRKTNDNSDQPLFIVDCRPELNALTNKVKGKGFEDPSVYTNISLKFFDIDHIHVMRNSFEKHLKCLQDPDLSVEDFSADEDRTYWHTHLKMVLNAAFYVSERLENGASVLVHCSDGWDRTSQIVALAQIIIDPYYRTFEGLQAIIEKDWILFGHKFIERCGLWSGLDQREISPIFTQFLECIYHLMNIYPSKFEFNQQLLVLINDEVYSSNYGTFVAQGEKYRKDLLIIDKTYSLWGFLENNKNLFLNPFYGCTDLESTIHSKSDPLQRFATSQQLFQIWRGLYLRWEWRMPHTSLLSEDLNDIRTVTENIDFNNAILITRINEVCKQLGKSDEEITEILSKRFQLSNESSKSSFKQLLPSEKLNMNPNSSDIVIQLGQYMAYDSTACMAVDYLNMNKIQLNYEEQGLHSKVSTYWEKGMPIKALCSFCGIFLSSINRKAHCISCGRFTCCRCLKYGKTKLMMHDSSVLLSTICCGCSK